MEYLPDYLESKDDPLWWHKQGLLQNRTGYGDKLTTPTKVRYHGRWYRVYATCYSNVPTHWIESKGERLYLRW
jgi:hypothetical protein